MLNLVSGLLVLVLRVTSFLARVVVASLVGFAIIWALIGAFAAGWAGVLKGAYIPIIWAAIAWTIHMAATALIARLGGGSRGTQPVGPDSYAGKPLETHSFLKIYPDGHVDQITIGTTRHGNNAAPPGAYRADAIFEHLKP